jgi:hypothetical protein
MNFFIDKDTYTLYLQKYECKTGMSEEKRRKLRAENRREEIDNSRYQSLPRCADVHW